MERSFIVSKEATYREYVKITDIEPLSELNLEYLKFEECFNISNYEV